MFFETPIVTPAVGTALDHDQAMMLALQEAAKGAPRVSPNPMVGAVVLSSDGNFLSSGFHEFYGGPHAEVNALKNLTPEQLKGATVYVTLEPCAHEGKTPSCAKMMATLPLKKVFFGLVDPNPLVSGQGADILRKAGIEAELFKPLNSALRVEFESRLEESCEAFLWNFRHKKVFVALKMASSLDGQVALKTGESQWITGPQSRESVHYLRACYDAVLVGTGTVRFDNPSLNVRHPLIQKKNKVVVLDAEAELLQNYKNLKLSVVHHNDEIIWCVSKETQKSAEVLISKLPNPPQVIFVDHTVAGELHLPDLLKALYDKGIRSVLVEGGALTASSFVAAGLVNRLYLYQAPILLGAGGSKSWTQNLRLEQMADKIILKNPRYLQYGPDIMVTARL